MFVKCLEVCSKNKILYAQVTGLLIWILTLSWWCVCAPAQTHRPGAANPVNKLPAFPGAEGFGAMTPGGRGGRVIYVTNLNDSGPGSLRHALSVETDPRFVLFKVSGTIALSGDIRIEERNSFVTVAGQTAPGDGIQLKNFTIGVTAGAHDVVIRHLRCRPGQGGVKIDPKTGKSNGSQIDGILVYGPGDQLVSNVIIDHCSVYWAVDENGDAFGMVQNTTFQWCIFAEGELHGHEKGAHSMGMLIGTSGPNTREMSVSVHHCLFAHNGGRNPQVSAHYTNGKPSVVADIRNNIIYNWGGNNGGTFYSGPKVNFVGNLYIPGPNSTARNVSWLSDKALGTRIFVEGNHGPNWPVGRTGNDWNIGFWDLDVWKQTKQSVNAKEADYRVNKPFPAPAVTTHAASELEDRILSNVGATKPKRDSVDARIVKEVRNRTGEVGRSSDYPVLVGAPAPTDTDNDGMPDSWETAQDLDPKNPTDGQSVASNGYTNIENYINELAGDPL
jgi:pectate lyase